LETSAPPSKPRSGRLDAIDWLRGLAVVLMIQTHLYDSWASPAAKATEAYGWSRFLGGIPSRLFLLLVGVSMAIKFEAQIAKGVARSAMVRSAVKRGAEIVVLAYLFRIQEYILGGGNHWQDLFRVDILNCIGASMIVTGLLAAPRRGHVQVAAALAAAGCFIALGPIVGPAHFPDFLPRPLTSYFGGERPMAWFPLFPWAAWPLVGVAIGHFWVRASREPRRQAIAYLITGVAGAALMGAVTLVRRHYPTLIHYSSEYVQQMGPESFLYRLGLLGPLALLAYLVSWVNGRYKLPSAMQQLGRTSLLVYWIHVELVYGLESGRLHHRLSMGAATVGFVLMTAAMLGVSVLKTRYWRGFRARRTAPALPPTPTTL
jgi:uncharacterized membrane protein